MELGKEYPDENDLVLIEKWPYQDPTGWMNFVRRIWHWPDWGITYTRRRIYISTGGWSGNEEIIGAMKKNWILWSQLWHSHRTGGHYIFIRKKRLG